MQYDIEKYKIAKQMYIDGESLTSISKKIGFERHKLSYLLKKDNIIVRKGTSKYDYKEDFFEKIDTEEKAYWLGFIYADGNIIDYGKYEIKISLAYKDLNHLKKFIKTILVNGNGNELVRPYIAKLKGKEYQAAKVIVANKKMVQDIIQLGCTPNKSLILTFPNENIVPKELQRHFIRGYFDGDGSVCTATSNEKTVSVIFLGTKNFVESVKNIFIENCTAFGKSKIMKRNNIYFFTKAKYDTCKEIYEYMYKNSTVYLERKYERFAVKYGKL